MCTLSARSTSRAVAQNLGFFFARGLNQKTALGLWSKGSGGLGFRVSDRDELDPSGSEGLMHVTRNRA